VHVHTRTLTPTEAKYQQQMVRLGKTTQLALQELQSQEECLPLIDLFRASVDQVVY